MTNQSESIDSSCPVCFCDLEDQPDGITEGVSNIVITGCCKKRLHSMCWDRSPKIKTWTEDKAFEKIREKLQPDQFYKARKCPFCRSLSDIRRVESKSTNDESDIDFSDMPPLIIELTSPGSGVPTAIGYQNQSEFSNQLLNLVLGQIGGTSSLQNNSETNQSPNNIRESHQNRARHRIHPYSNRERHQ